jgi:transketolase
MPFPYPRQSVRVGVGWTAKDGRDLVVFGYGPWMLANACEAAQQLEDETGASVRVVNLPWLNRVDADWLRETIGTCRSVVTLDNHYLHGGQGEMIAAAIAELGLDASPRVARVGVTELPECGTNDEVLAYHRLDIPSLVEAFRGALPKAVVERRATQLT